MKNVLCGAILMVLITGVATAQEAVTIVIPEQEMTRFSLGVYTAVVDGAMDFSGISMKLSFPLVGEHERLQVGGFVGRAGIEGMGVFAEWRHLLTEPTAPLQWWTVLGVNGLARKNYDRWPLKRTNWASGIYGGAAGALKVGSRRLEVVAGPAAVAELTTNLAGSLFAVEQWRVGAIISVSFTIL